MKGNTFEPNYDMFLWGWGGDPDPNFILSIFTTSQINSWSDCAWSDPQYDKLFLEQQTTIDPTKRAAIVHKMEQIIYQQSPYIPTVYPESVEAYDDKRLAGLVVDAGQGRRRVLHLAGHGELPDRAPGDGGRYGGRVELEGTADRGGRGDRAGDRDRRPVWRCAAASAVEEIQ